MVEQSVVGKIQLYKEEVFELEYFCIVGTDVENARLVKAANTFCRAFAGRGDQGAY